MIAGGYDVDSQIEKFSDDIGRQAKPGGGILAVGNHQVNPVFIDQAMKPAGQGLSPGPPDNVPDK
jgi:hypothetical protein